MTAAWQTAPALGTPKPGGGWQSAPAPGQARPGPTIEAAAQLPPQQQLPAGLHEDYSKTNFAQGTSGLNEGLANILGAPIDLSNAAIGLGMKGINKVFGTDFKPSEEPLGGSAGLKRSLRDIGSIREETDDPTQQFIRRTSQTVGSAVPAAIATGGVGPALQVLAPALLGGTAAATAKQVAPNYPSLEMAADLLGSAGGAWGVNKLNQLPTNLKNASAARNAPSRAAMQKEAGAIYDAAEASPAQATAAETTGIRDTLRGIAKKEGGITSTGQIADVADLKHALSFFDDAAGKPMTVQDMRMARKAIGRLASSPNSDDARIGMKMLKEFDPFMESYAPGLEKANKIYSQAMKSQVIENAMKQAKLSSETSQGMSYSRALHGEFKKLASDIIENPGGWTQDEIAAINLAAKGSGGEKVLRMIGKMRPSNAFGQLLSLGGTGGAITAAALGASPLGPLAGPAAAGLGWVSQKGSDALTKAAANYAEALTRGGGKVAQAKPAFSRNAATSVASTAATSRPRGVLGAIESEREERRQRKGRVR